MKQLLVLAICVQLSGCGLTRTPATPENVEAGCHIQKDDFKKSVMYFGPTYYADNYCTIYTGTSNPKSNQFALHATFTLTDWVFFESCFAKGGRELETHVNDRDVQSGYQSASCIEKMVVMVPRSDFELSTEGLQLKFFGKRGTWEIVVPQAYLRGWLNYLKKQN